jgi:hypothetical protein
MKKWGQKIIAKLSKCENKQTSIKKVISKKMVDISF